MPRLQRFRTAAPMAGVLAVTLVVINCSPGQRSNKPLKLVVSKVTKTATAQPVANTVAFGPNMQIVPQIESLTPKPGYTFVLFQLDVTNSSPAAITFEGVKLALQGSGLLEGKTGVYYLLKGEKTEPTYMSIGNPGIQPKEELKPGAGVTWQLMATVKETTRKLELSYPDANPAMIE